MHRGINNANNPPLQLRCTGKSWNQEYNADIHLDQPYAGFPATFSSEKLLSMFNHPKLLIMFHILSSFSCDDAKIFQNCMNLKYSFNNKPLF